MIGGEEISTRYRTFPFTMLAIKFTVLFCFSSSERLWVCTRACLSTKNLPVVVKGMLRSVTCSWFVIVLGGPGKIEWVKVMKMSVNVFIEKLEHFGSWFDYEGFVMCVCVFSPCGRRPHSCFFSRHGPPPIPLVDPCLVFVRKE